MTIRDWTMVIYIFKIFNFLNFPHPETNLHISISLSLSLTHNTCDNRLVTNSQEHKTGQKRIEEEKKRWRKLNCIHNCNCSMPIANSLVATASQKQTYLSIGWVNSWVKLGPDYEKINRMGQVGFHQSIHANHVKYRFSVYCFDKTIDSCLRAIRLPYILQAYVSDSQAFHVAGHKPMIPIYYFR